MKQLAVIILLCLFTKTGNCQAVAIQAERTKMLLACMDNPITIAVENTPCRDLVLTCDNGKVVKGESSCSYFINDPESGNAIITVKMKTKSGLKTIVESKFRVKSLPHYVFFNGRTGGGTFRKKAAIGSSGIRVGFECSEGEPPFLLLRFTVIVKRNQEEIFRRTIAGKSDFGRFDSTTKAFLYNLKNNDSMLFTDMIIQQANCTARDYGDNLGFRIIESENFHMGEEYEGIDPITGETIKKRY